MENLSDYNITVSSSIEAVYGDGGQLVEVKVTYSAQQETNVQTNSVIRQDISASRSYTFLDEELPSITFSETATSDGPYIMLEAGNSWDDSDGNSYYIWDTDKSSSTEVLTISAWDAVDGQFDSDNQTVTNISTSDSNTSISSASDFWVIFMKSNMRLPILQVILLKLLDMSLLKTPPPLPFPGLLQILMKFPI